MLLLQKARAKTNHMGGTMSILVVYYSKSGSNRYLAEKLAGELKADLQPIHPRVNTFGFLGFCTLIKAGPGFRSLELDPAAYDQVILVGPIWMGQLIAPLRGFLKKYAHAVRKLRFATCCGGGDETRNDKFGYEHVFKTVRGLAGDVCSSCEAFPITLVLSEGQGDSSDAVMKTRLSDANFTGPIQERFDTFVAGIVSEGD
jgi:flavodoxin